jgi:hypothetical protein
VVRSRTSLICCANWFVRQHHNHAHLIILELPAPFSDMMCSYYDTPIQLYKLAVNFSEGTRFGHNNCGNKCPGTLPLHTLHLLPWIATDVSFVAHYKRNIKRLCNTEATGLSCLQNMVLFYITDGYFGKISEPYYRSIHISEHWNGDHYTMTVAQKYKPLAHFLCYYWLYPPCYFFLVISHYSTRFYRQWHWNARNAHTVSDGMWHHVPLEVFPNVSKNMLPPPPRSNRRCQVGQYLYTSVNKVGISPYIPHLKTGIFPKRFYIRGVSGK